MKTEERKKHESTIPEWVRARTGSATQGFRFLTKQDSLVALFAYWTIGFMGTLPFIGFMKIVVDTYFYEGSSPKSAGALVFIGAALVGIIFAAVWRSRQRRAEQWLEMEWHALTGLPPSSIYVRHLLVVQPLRAALDHSQDRFHRVRDIAAWFCHCDPQLRPRDLERIESYLTPSE